MTINNALKERFGLEGKRAIITGAGSGIGKEIARLFAEVGATVVIADINLEAAEKLALELTEQNLQAVAAQVDVTDENSIVQLVNDVVSRHKTIDILVNNAGVFPVDVFLDTSGSRWDEVQQINLRGPFICMREVLRHMREAGQGGKVINISSGASILPTLYDEIPYNCSKAGLNMLTKAAALEFAADQININAIIPAFVITEGAIRSGQKDPQRRGPALHPDRRPLGRFGKPEDVANAALFLASPAANYITGHLLCCDGGYTNIT